MLNQVQDIKPRLSLGHIIVLVRNGTVRNVAKMYVQDIGTNIDPTYF